MSKLKRQVERVFGEGHQVVYPILFGFETDFDAAIFHGENGEVLDLSELNGETEDELKVRLRRMYPDMPLQMLNDLMPLVLGNIAHIAEVKASNRQLSETVHREWLIGVGRGFDWLHESNTGLLVGPFSPNLSEPVETAASIIRANMENGSIPKESFILLTSAIYRDSAGSEPRLAREKALFLRDFAVATIKAKYPDLAEVMHPLPVVVDMDTREMHVVED